VSIFISYARGDRSAVEVLARDLERTHQRVWMDDELTGGQRWWDTIIGQIRACDLFVFALSPESLKSRACRLELEYALALQRPLLPVQIRDVAISTAPHAVADTQIVDYRERTPESSIALVSAVMHRPPPPNLPEHLPSPPPPPMSYMNEFLERVGAPDLSFQQQSHLLVDLRGHLSEHDQRDTAVQLIQMLRSRRDIGMSVAQEIDKILDSEQRDPRRSPPEPGEASVPEPDSSGSYGWVLYPILVLVMAAIWYFIGQLIRS
jgi:hypothetical protein